LPPRQHPQQLTHRRHKNSPHHSGFINLKKAVRYAHRTNAPPGAKKNPLYAGFFLLKNLKPQRN
jgi:hypothetical protein